MVHGGPDPILTGTTTGACCCRGIGGATNRRSGGNGDGCGGIHRSRCKGAESTPSSSSTLRTTTLHAITANASNELKRVHIAALRQCDVPCSSISRVSVSSTTTLYATFFVSRRFFCRAGLAPLPSSVGEMRAGASGMPAVQRDAAPSELPEGCCKTCLPVSSMTALRFDIWLRERACGGGRPYLAACLVLVCLARFELVMAARRVTAHDIAQAGDMGGLINHAIDQIRAGNMKTKEDGASMLRSLTEQTVGAPGASKERAAIDTNEESRTNRYSHHSDKIALIAKAYGIKPLVALLSGGSSVAQRDAAGTLANIARGRLEMQEGIIADGGVKPLASMLRTGDTSAQEQAAAAIASVSQNLSQQAAIIEAGSIAPLVSLLKSRQVRYELASHPRSPRDICN